MPLVLAYNGRDPLFTYSKLLVLKPYIPPVKLIFISDVQCWWNVAELEEHTAVLWPEPEEGATDGN